MQNFEALNKTIVEAAGGCWHTAINDYVNGFLKLVCVPYHHRRRTGQGCV